MEARGAAMGGRPTGPVHGSFIANYLRRLVEERTVRWVVLGVLLVVASVFSLVSTSASFDPGWMFIVPVAIASITGGFKEGVAVAAAAAVLVALYGSAASGHFVFDIAVGVTLTRFALYGITSIVLGSFGDAHHSIQSGLRDLAFVDPLTDCGNVASFYEELRVLEAQGDRFALLLVDMDELKRINDEYGHQTGSMAIRTVANSLRRVVRGSDSVARYGGDEFVVVLKEADRAGAQIVVNRLREMLAAEPLPNAPEARIGVSVGVALYGEDGTRSEDLLAAADAAMYGDKRKRHQVPSPSEH